MGSRHLNKTIKNLVEARSDALNGKIGFRTSQRASPRPSASKQTVLTAFETQPLPRPSSKAESYSSVRI